MCVCVFAVLLICDVEVIEPIDEGVSSTLPAHPGE